MNRVKVKIKDIAVVKNGSTPSTKNDEYYDGDIIWITPKDLSTQNSRYIYKGERTITEEGYKNCSAVMVPKGTVLLSSRAPIGLLSIAGTELCTNQGFKNIVPHEGMINSEFLFYLLKTKIADIEKLGSGTTFKEVSKASLEGFTISIPKEIKDQQKIAAVTLCAGRQNRTQRPHQRRVRVHGEDVVRLLVCAVCTTQIRWREDGLE